MVPDSLWYLHDVSLVGDEEEKMKFKLVPVECKYHELAKQVNRTRCIACGTYFEEKKK